MYERTAVAAVIGRAPAGRSVGNFADEQVFGELLAVHAAARAAGHRETGVEQPRDGLHTVELAVPVQRESDQVPGVDGRPGHGRAPGRRFQRRVARLREHFVQHSVVAGQHHPFAEIRAHVNGHALVLVLGTGLTAIGPAQPVVGVPAVRPAAASGTALYPVPFQILQLFAHG